MAEVFGLNVAPLTLDQTLDQIQRWISDGCPRWVVTLNPEMAVKAQAEPAFGGLLAGADLITADGVGIVWAARQFGEPVPGRVSGIDLAEGLLRRGERRGTRFYFCGGRPGVAELAKERAMANHPGIEVVGTDHGYFDSRQEDEVVARIRASSPDVILVGLGSPRQDEFISRHRACFGRGVAIGVGGSLDVLAGVVQRAPLWVQRAKLEWLYRIISQPARWRRSMALPRFVWQVVSRRGGSGR